MRMNLAWFLNRQSSSFFGDVDLPQGRNSHSASRSSDRAARTFEDDLIPEW
jgi:hypothetical protein